MSAKKKKKVSRKQLQAEKNQSAARRRNWLLALGVVVVVVGFIGYSLATSGAGPATPITEGLSEQEIAVLPAAPVIGAQAPDFTILDVNDNSFTLSEAVGKPTALMFFHTW